MKCRNVWEKVGGRKFLVWFTNEAAIIGIGIFVGAKYGGEWGLAVIVGGILVNGLIYSAANVLIKAKLPGGTSVALGSNDDSQNNDMDNRRGDSHPDNRGPVDSVDDPVKPVRQGQGRGK